MPQALLMEFKSKAYSERGRLQNLFDHDQLAACLHPQHGRA